MDTSLSSHVMCNPGYAGLSFDLETPCIPPQKKERVNLSDGT